MDLDYSLMECSKEFLVDVIMRKQKTEDTWKDVMRYMGLGRKEGLTRGSVSLTAGMTNATRCSGALKENVGRFGRIELTLSPECEWNPCYS
jgi:hypothetical protein